MKPFKYNPNFNSGRFRHKITFQYLDETENEMGDVIKEWKDYKSAWAMIKTLRGKEFIQAQSIQGELTVRFIIKYLPGLTNDMKILYGNRIFEITAPPINDDELDETLTIMAREVV